MTYVNRTGEQYDPSGLTQVDRGLFEYTTDAVEQSDSGLYFRSRIFPALTEQIDACLEGDIPANELTIDAYQAWNERGWKVPHRSIEAVKRFSSKGLEELQEIDDAMEEYWDGEGSDHLKEEIGDGLYCPTALASNGGCVISDALQLRAFDYAKGTKVYTADGLKRPQWYRAAAELSIQERPITAGDLDTLVKSGFVARFSPAMNIDEDEKFSMIGSVFDMTSFVVGMAAVGERQYDFGKSERIDTFTFETLSKDLGIYAAEIYFRTTSIASTIGSSLGEIMLENIKKVEGRITTNTVDKTDGPRI